MYIYEIDENYIDFLYSIDNKVQKSKNINYKYSRKYLGVIFEINKIKYFAPLSSPKNKDFYSNGKIKPTSLSIIKIILNYRDKTPKLLGKIMLNNMIPIFDDKLIKRYSINDEENIKYRNLIYDELRFINKNKNLIIKNATTLYYNKINNIDDIYCKNSVDFKLLEEKCKEYNNK